jgi:hypothetical protein
MSTRTSWRVIPETRTSSALWLLVGLVVLASAIWQLQGSPGTPVLLVISAVLAVALIAVSTIGLLSPRLRGR